MESLHICSTLTEHNLMQKLRELDHKDGAGPNGIPPKFLKEYASQLYVQLHLIFYDHWTLEHSRQVGNLYVCSLYTNLEIHQCVTITDALICYHV